MTKKKFKSGKYDGKFFYCGEGDLDIVTITKWGPISKETWMVLHKAGAPYPVHTALLSLGTIEKYLSDGTLRRLR